MKIDDAITLMQETAQELRKDPMMRHYIWSPLEMQGVQAFEDGCPILRMRFRTAPEMQWDVSRAFNLLLKQRMEAQEIDLGVPRLSVRMEARSEARGDEPHGTDMTLQHRQQGDVDSPQHAPEPPRPAPRPTEAETRRDERQRPEGSTAVPPLAQPQPKSQT